MFFGPDNPKLAYSIDELVAATGTSRTLIRKEIKEGRLKAKKAGKRVLLLATDVEEWINGLTGQLSILKANRE